MTTSKQSYPTNPDTSSLLEAILALQSKDEAGRFLRDLLTESEIKEFANRWKAAQLLDEGVRYTDIVKSTGLSSTTVARIAAWLNQGMGGYRILIDRIHQHHESQALSR